MPANRSTARQHDPAAFRVQALNLLLLGVGTLVILMTAASIPSDRLRPVILVVFVPVGLYYAFSLVWRWRPLPDTGRIRRAKRTFLVTYTLVMVAVVALYALVLTPQTTTAVLLGLVPAVPCVVAAGWLWRLAAHDH